MLQRTTDLFFSDHKLSKCSRKHQFIQFASSSSRACLGEQKAAAAAPKADQPGGNHALPRSHAKRASFWPSACATDLPCISCKERDWSRVPNGMIWYGPDMAKSCRNPRYFSSKSPKATLHSIAFGSLRLSSKQLENLLVKKRSEKRDNEPKANLQVDPLTHHELEISDIRKSCFDIRVSGFSTKCDGYLKAHEETPHLEASAPPFAPMTQLSAPKMTSSMSI